MKRTAVFIMLMMLLACGGAARADEQALQDETTQREAALKMKKGQELIEAAKKIVEESGTREAEAMLKTAQESHREASARYEAGEHNLAAKGFSDAIQAAIGAVLLSSGPHEEESRDAAIQKAADDDAVRNEEKKKALLTKATEEVEAFMHAAGKIEPGGSGAQTERLQEAREHYDSSKVKSAEGDFDGALKDMTKAYSLATAAIKDLKRASGEALTFPKGALAKPNELLTYEMNRNDTYAFFASKTAGDNGKDSLKLLRAARKARDQAHRSIDKGDGAKAIERLRQSTELYLKAIRESGE